MSEPAESFAESHRATGWLRDDCLLIGLWTGGKLTLRTHEMACWYFCGMVDEEGLLADVTRLQKTT